MCIETIRTNALSIATQAASAEGWSRLCEVLTPLGEMQNHDEVEQLIDELEGHLSHWPDDLRAVNAGQSKSSWQYPHIDCHVDWWWRTPNHPASRLVRTLAFFMMDDDWIENFGQRHTLAEMAKFGAEQWLNSASQSKWIHLNALLDLPNNRQLKTIIITFDDKPGFGIPILKALAQSEHLTTLESIIFENVLLYEDEALMLIEQRDSLRRFKAHEAYDSDYVVGQMLRHESASKLTHIEIEGESALKAFSQCKHLTKLEHVAFQYGHRLTIEHWTQIGQILANGALTFLDISGCAVSDEALRCVLDPLSGQHLKTLLLNDNNLSDDGALYLANCKKLSTLESLEIEDNASISPHGYEHLAQSQHLAPNIRSCFEKEEMTSILQKIESYLLQPDATTSGAFFSAMGLIDEHFLRMEPNEQAALLDSTSDLLSSWPDDARTMPYDWWCHKMIAHEAFEPLSLCRRVYIHADRESLGNGALERIVYHRQANHLTILEVDPLDDQWYDLSSIGQTSNLRNLVSLSINPGLRIPEYSFYYAFEQWQAEHLPHLKHIHFRWCTLNNEDVDALVNGSLGPQLETLAIDVTTESSGGFGDVIAQCKNLSQLKHLSLKVRGDVNGLEKQIKASAFFPNLEVLQFS